MKNKSITIYLTIIGILFAASIGWYGFAFQTQVEYDPCSTSNAPIPIPTYLAFDGQRAYADVQTQVSFGPRIPGSEGHIKIQKWICEELGSAGWRVEVQESEAMGHPIRNIVAKRGEENPQIILGAHYDTRIFADNDPDPANHILPVPGANDGASGVAVLLELARVLPESTVPVWLVFFDAEDNGYIDGWFGILGSTEFVENNSVQPRAVVIVDMIGDADLNIYKERNSDITLTDEVWGVAKELGLEGVFIPEYKFSMTDDHTPFLHARIPAIVIIDFDYPYWHTLQDTADKVSTASLQAVGETLYVWMMGQSSQP